jgi:carbohydrate-selective porin OprB
LSLAACSLLLIIVSPCALAWQAGTAQQAPASSRQTAATKKAKKVDCPHTADPFRRQADCNDEDFDWDETLSHDFTGLRARLRKLGITPSLSYAGVLQTNASGRPHAIWSYAGQLTGGLDVDLQKLLKIRGMSVFVGGSWGTGSNLSGSLGTLFPVNPFYAPSYYLGEMYLQQSLLKGRLTLMGGRVAAANTFATLPVLTNYVNYGLNPNPYPLGGNDVTFFGPPTGTEWGAQATFNANRVVQVSAGMFNTNLDSANGRNHGTDFALQEGNKGALVIAEVSYFPHGIVTDEGKQGEYCVGVIVDNNSLPTLPDGSAHSDGYAAVYAMGQEMVYQPDGLGTTRGLTIWGMWAYNSKPLVAQVPLGLGAGASYQGLIPKRKNDIASVGWVYGKISDHIPQHGAEQVLELNYRWSYGRFLALTPDFQYIWHPGGRNIPGLTVVGVQAAVTF